MQDRAVTGTMRMWYQLQRRKTVGYGSRRNGTVKRPETHYIGVIVWLAAGMIKLKANLSASAPFIVNAPGFASTKWAMMPLSLSTR